MEKEELEFRISSTLAKGWNIIYYRTIEDRPRATYIHVVRDYRKQLLSLIAILPDSGYENTRSLCLDLINTIDPKVKTEECMGTIIRMDQIFKLYVK